MSKSKKNIWRPKYLRQISNRSNSDSHKSETGIQNNKTYKITFLHPVRVKYISNSGETTISPKDVPHTLAHASKDKLVFLLWGRQCGLPRHEFERLQNEKKVKITLFKSW